jgi:hypothetical protein
MRGAYGSLCKKSPAKHTLIFQQIRQIDKWYYVKYKNKYNIGTRNFYFRSLRSCICRMSFIFDVNGICGLKLLRFNCRFVRPTLELSENINVIIIIIEAKEILM